MISLHNHSHLSSPLITVVIPAFNEELTIEKSITSLAQQTMQNFELIVIDNDSTDKTAEIAKKLGAKVITEKRKGLSYARQTGFSAARAPIIVTTDSDSYVLDRHWLEKILDAFNKDPKLVGYGGLFRLYSGPIIARLAVRFGTYPLYSLGHLCSRKWMLIGPNFAVRKTSFEKVGGFSVGIPQGEDVDIAFKLSTVGKVYLDKHLIVYSSGRRFRHGLLSGLHSYGLYWILRVVFNQSTSKKLEDIREIS